MSAFEIDTNNLVISGIAEYQINSSSSHDNGRKIHQFLQTIVSALIESGTTIENLRGTKTGLFVGFSRSRIDLNSVESEFVNQISYQLGLSGPSKAINIANDSSLVVLDEAFKSIVSGECESAIVGAVDDIDVKTKDFSFGSFVVIFLQYQKYAQRTYASVLQSEADFKSFGIDDDPTEIIKSQFNFLTSFYGRIKIDPRTVNIVYDQTVKKENHIFLDKIFNSNDSSELTEINSIHSGELLTTTSGLMSIIESVKVFENTDVTNSLISVNYFGFRGTLVHILLQCNYKVKVNGGIPDDDIPRIVMWSGRTEESINSIIDLVTSRPLDAELVALMQSSQVESLPANIHRGYGIFTQNGMTENAKCIAKESQHFDGMKRPVVWVYSGMGSQWSGMGKDLMKIPMFAESIEKSHKVLAARGLNLKEIIISKKPKVLENILHTCVGIAAIQIALTDIMKALELKPDFIIGHSVGELGCAYADGCLTAEEFILSAYSRAMASLEAKILIGSMAVVDLGLDKLQSVIPDTIEIVCHNNLESTTVAGPVEQMKKFMADLKYKNIHFDYVSCSNVPLHSVYAGAMGPIFQNRLRHLIREPKERSSKWLSTSYPQSRWNESSTKFASPEYFTNNLLSTVLFAEISRKLPKNSLIVEIGPDGILREILKKSLPDATYVAVSDQKYKQVCQYFLQAVGLIHLNGFNLKIGAIYPNITKPVSRETPMISPSIVSDIDAAGREEKSNDSK